MTRRRGGGWPVNRSYPPQNPNAWTPPEPDENITVPVQDVQQEAIIALAEASEASKRWFDSPIGLVFKAVCGVMAVLIVISLGVLILTGIWGAIFS